MIKTKPYHLDKNEYAKIVIAKKFKKSWWLYLILISLAIVHLTILEDKKSSPFVIIFGLSYPFISALWLYFWATSSKKSLLFKETELQFDDSNLYFKRDGNESKIPRKNITKVVTKKDSWLLYISSDQFIYIAKNIFYSDDDYNSFYKLLNQNI